MDPNGMPRKTKWISKSARIAVAAGMTPLNGELTPQQNWGSLQTGKERCTDKFRAGLGVHDDELEARDKLAKLAKLSQTSTVKTDVKHFHALVNQIQSDPTGGDKVQRFLSVPKPELR